MEGFVIREARREDCKEIRRLIQELADFEKRPDGPKIDINVIERDGFDSQHPYFRCFVAEPSTGQDSDAVVPDNGQTTCLDSGNEGMPLLGYALFYFTYSTWVGRSLYLEDLYVTPSCRGQGVGSALFDKVAKKGFQSGCSRVDFSVLDWNPARDFYHRKGAVDMTEAEGWHHYRLEGAALEKVGGGQEGKQTGDKSSA